MALDMPDMALWGSGKTILGRRIVDHAVFLLRVQVMCLRQFQGREGLCIGHRTMSYGWKSVLSDVANRAYKILINDYRS